MGTFKHLDVRRVGVVTVATFRAQRILDDLIIQQIGEELYHLADSEPRVKLLVNFKGVAFLSSSVLGKLISLNKKCKANQGKLKLCEMNPKIAELFNITGLGRLFSIHKDELSALQDFY